MILIHCEIKFVHRIASQLFQANQIEKFLLNMMKHFMRSDILSNAFFQKLNTSDEYSRDLIKQPEITPLS